MSSKMFTDLLSAFYKKKVFTKCFLVGLIRDTLLPILCWELALVINERGPVEHVLFLTTHFHCDLPRPRFSHTLDSSLTCMSKLLFLTGISFSSPFVFVSQQPEVTSSSLKVMITTESVGRKVFTPEQVNSTTSQVQSFVSVSNSAFCLLTWPRQQTVNRPQSSEASVRKENRVKIKRIFRCSFSFFLLFSFLPIYCACFMIILHFC